MNGIEAQDDSAVMVHASSIIAKGERKLLVKSRNSSFPMNGIGTLDHS